MSAARTFRDLRVYQLARSARDWRSIAAMLARMIDRASDFCKDPADTDHRMTEKEEPPIRGDLFFGDSDPQGT